ncbi:MULTISPECIES: GNAT family N-acetyltransferase [Streptomyces]|uniref:GNAT family N-acetyltransferase n=1 Tax=Streptomyces TaxID=1883 RepID=UPI0036A5FA0A
MSRFTVRRAQPEDADALARLRWRFKQEDEPVPVGEEGPFVQECSEWTRARLAGAWLAWVAEMDGEVCGHVFVGRVEKVPKPGPGADALGYLTNFYVCPEYRNQGIGRALLDEAVRHGRQSPLDTLIVWPSERSAPLYVRAGFSTPEEVLELPIEL